MAVSQPDVRWRNDDGNETTATWIAALDTSISSSNKALDTNVRLRVVSTQTLGSATFKRKLQYNRNNLGWNDVTTISNVARMAVSVNVTNATATTQQISAGGFTAGEVDTTVGTTIGSVTLDVAGAPTTEDEFCLQVRSADTAAGDQILFRLFDATGNAAYGTYGNYAVYNVASASYDKGQFFEMFD